MNRVRIKICGITRLEDARCAVELGADALGFNFYGKSPRHVTVEQVRSITAGLPPFVTKVALLVDPNEEQLRQVLSQLPIDLIQFHGTESAQFCQSFGRPYIKVIRVAEGTDLNEESNRYGSAAAILLDSYVEGVAGGTGRTFDWSLIPKTISQPVVLAGGLNADNISEAIRTVRPFAVDVSGGVEREKGIKDRQAMQRFIKAVSEVGINA
ncbi:MAG: phosphoribosylanthranilate isomerase [Pseudomonadales bacterium]|nr:phosphoribosylanthranilate isomerase [Pseudomonadales bacterium]MDP7358496.1 phosphoribosylanthranilate isomerase [Pseudomonadales bacterium]MDP7595083.1 phosphoribosylanthranilate isomerase [Pseudomonadales bacterium]HJN51285.1 phosphoribosylanthranilate isomerase [Pseudomonadales bacterium]